MKAITDMLHGYIKKVCFSAIKAKAVFMPKVCFSATKVKAMLMLTPSFRDRRECLQWTRREGGRESNWGKRGDNINHKFNNSEMQKELRSSPWPWTTAS